MSRRAVSVQINYTLSLVIVTLLLSGTLLAANDVLQAERGEVVRSELEVMSNRVAADVGATDRLAVRAGGNSDQRVSVNTSIPNDLAGANYEIVIGSEDRGSHYLVRVTARAATLGVSDTVTLKTRTPVENTSMQGGAYTLRVADPSGGQTIVLERTDE